LLLLESGAVVDDAFVSTAKQTKVPPRLFHDMSFSKYGSNEEYMETDNRASLLNRPISFEQASDSKNAKSKTWENNCGP
jgi:hypothetical protein